MTCITTKSEFNEELCGVIFACNISLSKLNGFSMIMFYQITAEVTYMKIFKKY